MKKMVVSILLIALLSPCALADGGSEPVAAPPISFTNVLVNFHPGTTDAFESVEGIFSRVLDNHPLWDPVVQTMFA